MAQDKKKRKSSPEQRPSAREQLEATLETLPDHTRVVLVANLKGGTGKTTLSTHLAAWMANTGQVTALADLDPQRSALKWLGRRDITQPPIFAIDACQGEAIPQEAEWLILDGPAGISDAVLKPAVDAADVVLIPVLPSVFDEGGTARLMTALNGLKRFRKGKVKVGLVANRIKARSRAARRIEAWMALQSVPVAGQLRDSSLYADGAMNGSALFDLAPSRIRTHMADWASIVDFVQEPRDD
ncbi:MAG: AAA family ATPase [Bradymonadia bacterium]